jgi:hypothetical protein
MPSLPCVVMYSVLPTLTMPTKPSPGVDAIWVGLACDAR